MQVEPFRFQRVGPFRPPVLPADLAIEAPPEGGPPPRVAIVARELTRGGAAYLALRHARELLKRFAVDFVVTGDCDERFLRELPGGVSVFRVDRSTLDLTGAGGDVLRTFAARNEAGFPFRQKYHAVLGTSTFPDLAACATVCTLRATRKLVFLVDNSLAPYPHFDGPSTDLTRECLAAADLVLPVSRGLWEFLAEACVPLRERPWLRLEPPVDRASVREEAARPQSVLPSDGVLNVLSVGRLAPEKQYELCLRAHHRLKQQGLRFRWYVAGEGECGPALRAAVRELGMGEDFILLGKQDRVFPLMRACDVFALFSKAEGCPTVVLEALTLGRPTVMTAVSGSDEIVEHEATGLIVENNAEAIERGLARIVGDGRARERYRANLEASPARRGEEPGGPPVVDLASVRVARPSPRATILVPTYNQEAIVGKAIASALAQTFASLEVVLLDDASTDGTERLARSWSFDRRFRSIRNETNLGRVGNYRRGLTRHARGEWVLMLDGDDSLTDPGFVAKAFAAIDRHEGRRIVFAQAGHRVYHPRGPHRSVDVLPPIEGEEALLGGGDYLRFVFETGFFTHLGALYRRDEAVRSGFYTADISSSDMDSLLRLALRGEVLLLHTVAGDWVQHGGNVSARLPLDEFGPNVRLFDEVARQAVAAGLASWRDLRGPLTAYQARTLVYLFERLPAPGLGGLARLVALAAAINPRLYFDARFLGFCREALRGAAPPAPRPWGAVGRRRGVRASRRSSSSESPTRR